MSWKRFDKLAESTIADCVVQRLRRPRAPRATLQAAFAIALIAALTLSASASARPQGFGELGVFAEPNKAPKVTKQPSSLTVEEAQSATFTSTASGVPTPTVQWERSTNGGASWGPIEEATTTTLTIASATTAENASQYRAVFKNVVGEATSKVATLTVQKAPAITKQPINVTAEEGQNAVFEATASGFPNPTVKWESSSNGGKSWTAVAGGTANQLTLTSVKTSQTGQKYRATFKNVAGEATTEVGTLTVQKLPAITKQPANYSANEGQSVLFEATASGFPTPTVQWELSSDAGGSWSAIEGATANQLTIASANLSENGNMYRAVFSNAAGSATSSAATLSVHAAPVVTDHPIGVIVEVGETATFEAAASGFPTPTVQWERSINEGKTWSTVSGATARTFTVENAQALENGYQYRAVFTSSAGKAISNAAALTVATSHFSAVGWGDNVYRQLGDGFKEVFSDVPVPVTGLKFVTAVAAGGRHSLALLADGSVAAWGANGQGQLGDGGTAEKSVPVAVQGLTGVKAIAAGASHSLALLKNGTVMAWGSNEAGQLGINSNAESALTPVTIPGLSGVKAIAAGASHSLALLTNGTVMAWGENESGQLGTGNTKSSKAPVAVKHLTGVSAVAGGAEFSLALLTNGTLQAWGNDERGQLANATLEEEPISDLPIAVEGVTGASAIAAGAQHALALLTSGSVMAWGEDSYGEIGNGTIKTSQNTPVAVSGLSGVTAISAGSQDSAALLGTGSVMTWGNNSSGVLGYGIPSGVSAVPVAVVGLTKAASISAGRSHMLAFGEPIPVVTSVSPNIGPAAGGATVTITGSSFIEATAVKFGSAQATSFSVDSAGSITATAPPGSATVDVTVTTPSGTSPAVAADRYTYQTPPTVSKLSVKSGPAGGGASVTITGTQFTAATNVSFGSAGAIEFTVNSSTSITAVAPASVSGTVDVTVTNTAGASAISSKDRFKYLPVVAELSPNSGSTLGGSVVTITGSGFALGTTATVFKFGTVKAKSVNCTSVTSCTVTAPAHAPTTVDVKATVSKASSAAAAVDQFSYS